MVANGPNTATKGYRALEENVISRGFRDVKRQAEHLKHRFFGTYHGKTPNYASSTPFLARLHEAAAAARKAVRESTDNTRLRHAAILAIARGMSFSVAPITRLRKLGSRSRRYSDVPLFSDFVTGSAGQMAFLSGAERSVASATSAISRAGARRRPRGITLSALTAPAAALGRTLPGRKVRESAGTPPLASALALAAAGARPIFRRREARAAALRREAQTLGVKSALARLHHPVFGAAAPFASDHARIGSVAPRGGMGKQAGAAGYTSEADARLQDHQLNGKLQGRPHPAADDQRRRQITDHTRAADQEASLRQALEDLFDRQARLPPSGITGFDPRLTPAWAGRKLPG